MFLKMLWLAAVAACVSGTSSVLLATCCLPSSWCFHQWFLSLIATCSGKILVRFEPIHLIFNVLMKGYNGIHNLLLIVRVLWCTHPLSFADPLCWYRWVRMLFWRGNIERINFKICLKFAYAFFFWFHFCVGIGFMDLSWERMGFMYLSWERMRRVLKSAFAYNGVSLFWSYNPVTNMLLVPMWNRICIL